MPRPRIPRPVWLLGWASLATDLASEAIYPLLPLFLTRLLHAGAFSLGLIEGVAEATASLLKVVSGHLADRWRVRKPIVLAGYGLSSAVRPLMALVTAWPQVLLLRFLDRVGKGLRGAPRDAMLAAWADPTTRGWVYGFHRAMDHGGAVAGPLAAAAFLFVAPEGYRALFALTLVPGIVVMVLLAQVPEPADRGGRGVDPPGGEAAGARLPARFFAYLAVLALFTLGNSTDAFLLLRLSDLGVSAPWVPLLWAALHIVKAGASLLGGRLADLVDRRRVIAVGWIVYAMVYCGFAVFDAVAPVVALFLSYGLYFGLTEGPERALVVDLVPPEARATAFGLYGAVVGLGALAASVVFGLIWQEVSPSAAFLFGAALAALAAGLLPLAVPR